MAEAESARQLVRRAKDGDLASHPSGSRPWCRRFDDLVERIQRRMAPDIMPDEIETDITVARAEVRETHQSRRSRSASAQDC